MPNTSSVLVSVPTADLRRALKPYAQSNLAIALWQIANTVIPYGALWWLMAHSVQNGWPYLITLLLAIPAAGLMVRIFIIFHDCTHRSFFAARWANTLVGIVTGLLTFTAYHSWRMAHIKHHATAADLDRRGFGDVWTLTVTEYRKAAPLKRTVYRLFRQPVVMFLIGGPLSFVLAQRIPKPNGGAPEWWSVLLTDLALAALIIPLGLTIGWRTLLLVQLPILWLGSALGVWLFYVQHQFEGVYWSRHADWDATRAALDGCSYLKPPGVLNWFTGSIGVHHVHHLRPAIPNYRLVACEREVSQLAPLQPLTARQAWQAMWLDLYDEQAGQLISFAEAQHRYKTLEAS